MSVDTLISGASYAVKGAVGGAIHGLVHLAKHALISTATVIVVAVAH
jgi:hypothetical protein